MTTSPNSAALARRSLLGSTARWQPKVPVRSSGTSPLNRLCAVGGAGVAQRDGVHVDEPVLGVDAAIHRLARRPRPGWSPFSATSARRWQCRTELRGSSDLGLHMQHGDAWHHALSTSLADLPAPWRPCSHWRTAARPIAPPGRTTAGRSPEPSGWRRPSARADLRCGAPSRTHRLGTPVSSRS